MFSVAKISQVSGVQIRRHILKSNFHSSAPRQGKIGVVSCLLGIRRTSLESRRLGIAIVGSDRDRDLVRGAELVDDN